MAKNRLTATIITLNEEENLRRAINSVSFADEVVVIDSGSHDKTVQIAEEMNAKVIQNGWPGYGKQKNFAQDHCSNDWILNIDADEEVSKELAQEISALLVDPPNQVYGFFIPRKTFYFGKWILHGGWYPNHLIRLSHKNHSRWTEPRVHETLKVEGSTLVLKSDLYHYTFSSVKDQIQTNLRYAREGADELKGKGKKASLFRLCFKPIGKFIETYFIKMGFLDGLAGFIISINAAHSMFLKYAFLIEDRNNENARH